MQEEACGRSYTACITLKMKTASPCRLAVIDLSRPGGRGSCELIRQQVRLRVDRRLCLIHHGPLSAHLHSCQSRAPLSRARLPTPDTDKSSPVARRSWPPLALPPPSRVITASRAGGGPPPLASARKLSHYERNF